MACPEAAAGPRSRHYKLSVSTLRCRPCEPALSKPTFLHWLFSVRGPRPAAGVVSAPHSRALLCGVVREGAGPWETFRTVRQPRACVVTRDWRSLEKGGDRNSESKAALLREQGGPTSFHGRGLPPRRASRGRFLAAPGPAAARTGRLAARPAALTAGLGPVLPGSSEARSNRAPDPARNAVTSPPRNAGHVTPRARRAGCAMTQAAARGVWRQPWPTVAVRWGVGGALPGAVFIRVHRRSQAELGGRRGR